MLHQRLWGFSSLPITIIQTALAFMFQVLGQSPVTLQSHVQVSWGARAKKTKKKLGDPIRCWKLLNGETSDGSTHTHLLLIITKNNKITFRYYSKE